MFQDPAQILVFGILIGFVVFVIFVKWASDQAEKMKKGSQDSSVRQ